jgi:hypothetical protein
MRIKVRLGFLNFVIQPFEARTTFYEMCLFNDASQIHDTSFILNGREWGEGKIGREREKEREWIECGRWSVAEKELRRGS